MLSCFLSAVNWIFYGKWFMFKEAKELSCKIVRYSRTGSKIILMGQNHEFKLYDSPGPEALPRRIKFKSCMRFGVIFSILHIIVTHLQHLNVLYFLLLIHWWGNCPTCPIAFSTTVNQRSKGASNGCCIFQ